MEVFGKLKMRTKLEKSGGSHFYVLKHVLVNAGKSLEKFAVV
jgi:hypothetical protein